ncbi:hypothetical protein J0X19_22900 [Hymenobacter sp. BT186]|uniref:Transposase DDE domain-containing protein n=1 Tax=Hymenobacter telluris TaxID=2816474 RepID=A0A939F148_9BACT|nr:hypothetical protein [Hymenobacter telluris]MBO0360826.1 hypothetical protein [Hymenobacter telluris]MBW3376855.1 hypothetical protein [Hymenobacter norwichensis]
MRQSTVKPVLGGLLQHYGLRQVNMCGRVSAHETMLLATMAYNLKKLLQYRPQQQLGLAFALPKPPAPPTARPLHEEIRATDNQTARCHEGT